MAGFDFKGINDLKKELEQLAKNVQDVASEYNGKNVGVKCGKFIKRT